MAGISGLAGFLSLMVALAALAGCAAPRYQVVTRYQGPADASGRACVAGCEEALTACRERCRARYQTCIQEVEPQARAHYAEVLERYAAELSRYREALERYRFDLWAGWGHDPWWLGHGWYRPWPRPSYYPGPPPAMPDRATEIARYQQRACAQDCGCQSAYDGCFLACGGTRTVETRCVADCPEGTPE